MSRHLRRRPPAADLHLDDRGSASGKTLGRSNPEAVARHASFDIGGGGAALQHQTEPGDIETVDFGLDLLLPAEPASDPGLPIQTFARSCGQRGNPS